MLPVESHILLYKEEQDEVFEMADGPHEVHRTLNDGEHRPELRQYVLLRWMHLPGYDEQLARGASRPWPSRQSLAVHARCQRYREHHQPDAAQPAALPAQQKINFTSNSGGLVLPPLQLV